MAAALPLCLLLLSAAAVAAVFPPSDPDYVTTMCLTTRHPGPCESMLRAAGAEGCHTPGCLAWVANANATGYTADARRFIRKVRREVGPDLIPALDDCLNKYSAMKASLDSARDALAASRYQEAMDNVSDAVDLAGKCEKNFSAGTSPLTLANAEFEDKCDVIWDLILDIRAPAPPI